MSDHLYRFRSIHALLDGHQELEKQQIYFCPPDQLNDTLEGFKDIFWKGDHIVWRNLLRHYLLNLIQAASVSAIMGKDFSPNICSVFVHQTEDDLPQTPIRDTYATLCREFFGHSAPELLIATLASQERAVRRDELSFYLRLIQPLAISKVLAVFGQRGLMQMQSTTELDKMTEGMTQKLEEILRAHTIAPELADTLFSANENISIQLALIHEFNNPISADHQSWLFITRDFPSFYVDALERLLYPDWHAACFVANPINTSMWGTYGDGHGGVCLKFRTRTDNQGFRTLDLYRASSWSGDKNGVVANYTYVPHRFEEMRYTAEFPEVDFFESMGTLSVSKLNKFWFTGPDGKRSTTASRMLREDETWREEYWRKFAASNSTKSPEWKHEEEYRLILSSNLQRFDDLESRKLNYRFSDLTGIIFGIKTTTRDKLQIMRIIENKCISESRQDFEFYQAHYSNRTKKIELAPLSLLKVELN